MTLFELTKKLIDIPSVTGEEAQIASFLEGYLRESGFEVQSQSIEGDRRNLLATSSKPPKVLFCTHMDTVPPFIPANEDDEFIYGRGACDAKGIMAAMIMAAQESVQKGTNEVGLLLVVGEETDSIGAKTANELKTGSEYIVVGEPTENKLGKGHKGIVALELSATGRAAHSSMPELGSSAIEKLLDALQALRSLDFGESDLGKSTLNIGTIAGGVAHNVIPDSATAQISIRNARTCDEILQKLESNLDPEIEIKTLTRSEPQQTVVLPGFGETVLPFCTDIPHLKKFGRPLLFGPGTAKVAHTAEEHVRKSQLSDAVENYQKIVHQLLREADSVSL